MDELKQTILKLINNAKNEGVETLEFTLLPYQTKFIPMLADFFKSPYVVKDDSNDRRAAIVISWPPEAVPAAKKKRVLLTSAKVREIRRLYDEGRSNMRNLAKLFGVSKSAIHLVLNGKINGRDRHE